MGDHPDDSLCVSPILEERTLRDARAIGESGRLGSRGLSRPGWCPGCACHTLRQALEIFLAAREKRDWPILVTGPGCLEGFLECLAPRGLLAPPGTVTEIARGAALDTGKLVLALIGDEECRRNPGVFTEAGEEGGALIRLLLDDGPGPAGGDLEPGSLTGAEPEEIASELSALAELNSIATLRYSLRCPKRP